MSGYDLSQLPTTDTLPDLHQAPRRFTPGGSKCVLEKAEKEVTASSCMSMASLPEMASNNQPAEAGIFTNLSAAEPWDEQRFVFKTTLQRATRQGVQVDLMQDLQEDRMVVVKSMPYAWTREGPQEWAAAASPEEREHPWKDIGITHYLNRVLRSTCACDFIGLYLRNEQQGQKLCLVLSYCAGGDLFSWLERAVSDRERVSQFLIRSVLQLVNELHSRGIAHGDLSLENVLANDPEARDLKLIDFAACTLGGKSSMATGKRSYQAPEMHLGGEFDTCKADSFSVGVMAFSLLAGNYPWDSTQPGFCPRFRCCTKLGFQKFMVRYKIENESTGEVQPFSEMISSDAASFSRRPSTSGSHSKDDRC